MIQPSPAINHVDSGRENPVHVFYRFSQTREIEPEAVRVDAATRSFGCSAARPLCLVVVRGVPVQDAIAEAELTELFEVFSSINEAWDGLDKRAVSTMLVNTVDTGSKRVFTWGSSSRDPAPNDCHSLANRSFSGSRSARWCCWGQRAAGRPRWFPWLGQWSRVDTRSVVAGRQPTGTRYVDRPREQPGIAAAKLKDYTRALRESTT
jgi:hypothetical protein